MDVQQPSDITNPDFLPPWTLNRIPTCTVAFNFHVYVYWFHHVICVFLCIISQWKKKKGGKENNGKEVKAYVTFQIFFSVVFNVSRHGVI